MNDKPELKGVSAIRYKLLAILGFLIAGAFDKEFVDEAVKTTRSALKELDEIVIGLTADQKKYVTDWLEDVEENLSEIDGELHGEDYQALKLLRILINTPAMSPDVWQAIETAPTDGTVVLAYDKINGIYEATYSWKVGQWHNLSSNRFNIPTHWMTLIAPPNIEKV